MGWPGGDAGLWLLMGRSTQGGCVHGCVNTRESRHNEQQRQILRRMCYLCQGAGVQQQDACWDTRRGSDANAWTPQSWPFHLDHMASQSTASESPQKRLQILKAYVEGECISPPLHTRGLDFGDSWDEELG